MKWGQVHLIKKYSVRFLFNLLKRNPMARNEKAVPLSAQMLRQCTNANASGSITAAIGASSKAFDFHTIFCPLQSNLTHKHLLNVNHPNKLVEIGLQASALK